MDVLGPPWARLQVTAATTAAQVAAAAAASGPTASEFGFAVLYLAGIDRAALATQEALVEVRPAACRGLAADRALIAATRSARLMRAVQMLDGTSVREPPEDGAALPPSAPRLDRGTVLVVGLLTSAAAADRLDDRLVRGHAPACALGPGT